MIKVSPVPNSNLYELIEEYVYEGENNITIPSGFRWNGASIPSYFWSLLKITPFSPSTLRASLLHDYLYAFPDTVSKREADLLFFEILLKDGISIETANLFLFALTIFNDNQNISRWPRSDLQ